MSNNYLELYFRKISSELEKIDESQFKKFVYFVKNLKKKNKIIFGETEEVHQLQITVQLISQNF